MADGRLLRGAHGYAGELGHMVIEPSGPLCTCGNRGCLEQLTSGTALDRKSAELYGGEAGAPELAARARAGEEGALEALAEAGAYLGVAIANLVNALDPEKVVVGGGLAELGDLILGPARARAEELVLGKARGWTLLPAAFGSNAGLIGAGALVFEQTASA